MSSLQNGLYHLILHEMLVTDIFNQLEPFYSLSKSVLFACYIISNCLVIVKG
jgi:hypothetical protein